VKPVIEIEDVHFGWGAQEVLHGITFNVQKSDFLAVIGQNGSGKTTLLKLILGLYRPQAGIIRLFGKKIQDFTSWNRIGYVPQKVTNIDQFFPATVAEIVGLSGRSTPDLIGKALETVGMEKYRDCAIGELSGGQQQRVFIAKAIIGNPEILFLDEPTTGVDRQSQDTFYRMLDTLNKRGITIILITHDIGSITKYVTKVACLNKTLVFHGTHEEFCNSKTALQFLTEGQHMICHTHDA
jgi:zinc transport system ATP-binding protein